jgi:hypothetical protein
MVATAPRAGVVPPMPGLHQLSHEEGTTAMNILMPDLGKLIYLAIGFLVVPKIMSKVKGG